MFLTLIATELNFISAATTQNISTELKTSLQTFYVFP